MIDATVSTWHTYAAGQLREPVEARHVNNFLAGLVAGALFWFMYRHPVLAAAIATLFAYYIVTLYVP